MAKVREFTEGSKNNKWLIFCPACKHGHAMNDRWTFNGDFEKPTFNPSLLVEGEIRCHSFVRDGKIQYLSDCTHALAGQTVELEEF